MDEKPRDSLRLRRRFIRRRVEDADVKSISEAARVLEELFTLGGGGSRGNSSG